MLFTLLAGLRLGGTPRLFVCLLASLLLAPLSAMGQTALSGRALDSAARPVGFAQVMVKNPAGERIIAFTQADAEGRFSLSVPYQGEVLLVVQSLGFEPSEIPLTLAPGGPHSIRVGDIRLEPRFEQIADVRIETTRPVERKGDTIIYRTSAFMQGDEKNLHEVLKKMPGIQVDDDGRIKYRDREIEHVAVGGVDLFGKGYQMLTRNISPAAVEAVEVIENYEENRLLRMDRETAKVALNLQLAKGATSVSGTLRAALGYPWVHDAQASLIAVTPRQQWSLIANSNQMGVTPSGNSATWFDPVGLNWMSHEGGAGVAYDLGLRSPSIATGGRLAPLSTQRARRNMSHMLTLGTVARPIPALQVKAYLLGQMEDDSFLSTASQLYNILGQPPIALNEATTATRRSFDAGARLILAGMLAPSADLRYDGGYTFNHRTSVNDASLLSTASLHERLRYMLHQTDHTLALTQLLPVGVLQVGASWQSQWLASLYGATMQGPQQLLLRDATGDELQVKPENTQHQANAEATWIYMPDSKLRAEATLGYIYLNEHISYPLSLGLLNTLGAPEQWRRTTHDAFAGGMASYRLKRWRFSASLYGHLYQPTLAGTDSQRGLYLYATPILTTMYKRGSRILVQLQYQYNGTQQDIFRAIASELPTSYRTASQGRDSYLPMMGHTASLLCIQGDPLSTVMTQVLAYYTRVSKAAVSEELVTAYRSLYTLYRGKPQDYAQLSATFNAFIFPMRSNLKLEALGGFLRYSQRINALELLQRQFTYQANIVLRTQLSGLFNLSIGARWTTYHMLRQPHTFVHNNSEYADLVFRFPYRIDAVITLDRQEVGWMKTGENAIYFLDASLRWQALKNRLTVYAEGTNLLNQRFYSQRVVSPTMIQDDRFTIPGLRVLAGLQWQF